MSNTWDYQFAFVVRESADVPPEFRSAYERLVTSAGRPSFALFTPAVDQSHLLVSRWLPPRLILVCPEALALLSLETDSDRLVAFELSRQDFLGCGLAEFLLDCWFTLYPGEPSGNKVQIRFPSLAFEKYEHLVRFLQDWSVEANEVPLDQRHGAGFLDGLPRTFSRSLEAHPEWGPVAEYLFQPILRFRRKGATNCSNLLLVATPRGVATLSDEYGADHSDYGVDVSFFPLARVSQPEWIESTDKDQAIVQVYLRGRSLEHRLSWRVFRGLKPYALRWIEALNHLLREHAPECLHPEQAREPEPGRDSLAPNCLTQRNGKKENVGAESDTLLRSNAEEEKSESDIPGRKR